MKKIVFGFCCLALLLAACGSAGVKATPPPMKVAIKGFLFKPEMIQVPVGTTVTWTNEDDINHSVTEGMPPTPPAGGFDSDFFPLGKTYSRTFDQVGEYHYFCKRHNHMVGTIQVVAQPH